MASDVHGLAAALWTLLAGHSPFQLPGEGADGNSLMALIARLASSPPPDLRPAGLPSPVAAVLEAGLAKDALNRPATAVALGRALQQAQRSLAVAVTPLPIPGDAGPHRDAMPPPTPATPIPPRSAAAPRGV